MKTDIFPINYFKSIWTPIQAFKNRHELNWFQLIIVLVFLNALLTIPVTMNYAQMESFPLEDIYPNTVQMIDEQAVNELNNIDYENGEMLFTSPFIIENEHGTVAGGLDVEQREELMALDDVLIFEQNQFLINEVDAPSTTVLYTKDFSLEGLEQADEVENELSRQWFNQNRVLIVLIFSLMISVFLFMMTILIVAGSALLLYFTRKTDITSITKYKESVNLILNVLSLPTIAAMIVGLFYFDVTILVTVQYLGLVIMLFVIYYKTQFNDKKLEK